MENKNKDSFATRLTRGISGIERRHKQFMNSALSEYGKTFVPYGYFMVINRCPGISQEELAEFFGVNKSHVARIVRDLELRGYIKRELSPEDRRQYMLELTDSGKELHEKIWDRSIEWEEHITEGIDEHELTVTIDTLTKILENLKKGEGK